MKRHLFLSIVIISTFFVCWKILYLLNQFGWTFSSSNVRMNVRWGLSLLIVLGVSAVLYGAKDAFSSLGLKKEWLSGMGYGLLFSAPMLVGYALIGQFVWSTNLLLTVMMIFFWAAMEEVVFRGFLFGQLFQKAKWGFIPAATLNALIFGAGHLYQAQQWSQAIGIFAITLMGALWFAWLYIEWDSNLWVVIGLHFFMNLSWDLFSIGETALGGWGANLFRIMTIAYSIVLTIIYQQQKGGFRITKANLIRHQKSNN